MFVFIYLAPRQASRPELSVIFSISELSGKVCPLLTSFQRTQDFFDYLTPPLQPYLQFVKLFLYQYFKYLFLSDTNILPFLDIPKYIQIFSDYLTFIIYILKRYTNFYTFNSNSKKKTCQLHSQHASNQFNSLIKNLLKTINI